MFIILFSHKPFDMPYVLVKTQLGIGARFIVWLKVSFDHKNNKLVGIGVVLIVQSVNYFIPHDYVFYLKSRLLGLGKPYAEGFPVDIDIGGVIVFKNSVHFL